MPVHITSCASLSKTAIITRLEKAAAIYNTEENLQQSVGYRKAAVLVPLFCDNNEWNILFTRRTQEVQDHKGQVAFPGGAFEETDRSLVLTALREAEEEIGIRQEDVEILGVLPTFPTISHYLVTPVVGVIKWPNIFKLASQEVDRIFSIPLSWLTMNGHYREQWMRLSDGREGNVVFFKPYDGEVVWGITGSITLNLMRILALVN